LVNIGNYGGSSKYGNSKGMGGYGTSKPGNKSSIGGYGNTGMGSKGMRGNGNTGMGSKGMSMGGFVNTPSTITDDYTFCDMCSRKYNEQAYIRHLPTCERRTKDAVMKTKLKGTSSGSTGFTGKTLNSRK
jgi:hypothetical protein